MILMSLLFDPVHFNVVAKLICLYFFHSKLIMNTFANKMSKMIFSRI